MINIDEVGTKALTTAIGVLGPRIAAAAAKPRGQRAADLSIARWFETYRITAEFPDLPDLSSSLAERLADLLAGDETQAALQELLAARLTDADNAEAERAREAFCLTLSTADPAVSPFGPPLADFYDNQVSSLVARLGAAEPKMLAQIRSEAMSARMIAILRAIERHTAALTARPNSRTEASFLASYRTHVRDQYGKLEPPDFDRRRRVPISDIYVPPGHLRRHTSRADRGFSRGELAKSYCVGPGGPPRPLGAAGRPRWRQDDGVHRVDAPLRLGPWAARPLSGHTSQLRR